MVVVPSWDIHYMLTLLPTVALPCRLPRCAWHCRPLSFVSFLFRKTLTAEHFRGYSIRNIHSYLISTCECSRRQRVPPHLLKKPPSHPITPPHPTHHFTPAPFHSPSTNTPELAIFFRFPGLVPALAVASLQIKMYSTLSSLDYPVSMAPPPLSLHHISLTTYCTPPLPPLTPPSPEPALLTAPSSSASPQSPPQRPPPLAPHLLFFALPPSHHINYMHLVFLPLQQLQSISLSLLIIDFQIVASPCGSWLHLPHLHLLL